jgi:hypothetical protein
LVACAVCGQAVEDLGELGGQVSIGEWPLLSSTGSTPSSSRATARCQSGGTAQSSVQTM